MWSILGNLLAGVAGSLTGRMLAGAGLALATFAGIQLVVDELMLQIQNNMSGLPAGVAAIISMSGVGDGLSMVGSAFLGRAAMVATMVGVKKAAG